MKKNKIVNKIGILVLAVMLSILSSITVLASEPEEAELMFARIFFGFYDYEQR